MEGGFRVVVFAIFLYLLFAFLFFFILYHVIYSAITAANRDSELAREVRELKQLLAARLAVPPAPAQAELPPDPALTEACPGCGNRVHPQDSSCPDCGLTLR